MSCWWHLSTYCLCLSVIAAFMFSDYLFGDASLCGYIHRYKNIQLFTCSSCPNFVVLQVLALPLSSNTSCHAFEGYGIDSVKHPLAFIHSLPRCTVITTLLLKFLSQLNYSLASSCVEFCALEKLVS